MTYGIRKAVYAKRKTVPFVERFKVTEFVIILFLPAPIQKPDNLFPRFA